MLLIHLFSLLFLGTALGAKVEIGDANTFINFANNVNKGINYTGTTVFLTTDIDLSGKTMGPIGNNTYYFLGTFDGQGYAVRNLALDSTLEYTGLFGYSKGLTIKNFVIGNSCTVKNSKATYGTINIGGIIGYCYSYDKSIIIENSINKASITFTGNIGTGAMYLGGIIGCVSNSFYVSIKNCANYGALTHAGTKSGYSYIGGISGQIYGSSKSITVRNCLNCAAITHSGTTTSNLYMGGIVGYSYGTSFENCVIYESISSTTSNNYIGSVAGYLYTSVLKNCYWSDSISYDAYGSIYSSKTSDIAKFNTNFILNETITVGDSSGTSLINALNAAAEYYTLYDYSRWLLNKNGGSISFIINGAKVMNTLKNKIIIIPSLANEGKLWFDGWYTDSACSAPLTTFSVTSSTGLYGKWAENTNKYKISFDTRGGTSIDPITAQYLSVMTLPSNSIRENCNLTLWENEYGDIMDWDFTIPAHNITLYAVWACTHISSAEELIEFSNTVDKGITFEGETVFLDSDIDFTPELSKLFEPIGCYSFGNNKYFLGTFDGRGHVINSLEMGISFEYVGLFGYSLGLTIKNVVLDDSCSITNSYSGSSIIHLGGILGSCSAQKSACNIENSINMASITFAGNIGNNYLDIGGIFGSISYSSHIPLVKNCANYGSLVHSGTSGLRIGGISGYSSGGYLRYLCIQNCLNYGTITYNEATISYLYMGGIVGYSYGTYFSNCVNYGSIPSATLSTYVGNIAGYVTSSIISNCYWSDSISYDAYGSIYSSSSSDIAKFNTNFILNETITVGDSSGTSLINALNAAAEYYTLYDYSRWLLNKNGKIVTFTINNKMSSSTLKAKIILLPSLASEGKLWFDGWYTDSACSVPLTTFSVTSATGLYCKWVENTNKYKISFDTRGGTSIDPITAQYLSVMTLPSNSIREGCSISYWETEYGDKVDWDFAIPAHNITLYAVWFCTHISSAEEFIEFSNTVNNGLSDYYGETVFLDSDIDFNDKILVPVGEESIYFFKGSFDGQGHTISNLKIDFSSRYVGLFGYSNGMTFENVVFDDSCSVVSYYSNTNAIFMSSMIGYCYGDIKPCTLENSVNLASITFAGDIGNYISYLGGLIGNLKASYSHGSIMKNCANYGTVTHNGKSTSAYIGGVSGYTCAVNSQKVFIYNCLNYGTLTHSGETSFLYIGGITGYTSYYVGIENCVSAGGIVVSNKPSNTYIGNTVGYASSTSYYPTNITNCFWTSGVGYDIVNGTGSIVVDAATSKASPGSALINKLNSYSLANSWNSWLLNSNKASISFKINGWKGFTVKSQIILLPYFVGNSSRTFTGWYNDADLTSSFTASEVKTATTMYGCWVVDVAFDVNGGNELGVNKKIIKCNETYGKLPSPTKVGYSFVGWFTERDGWKKIESENKIISLNNHTLYASWTINNYTLKFVFNNSVDDDVVSILDYNEQITYPDNPEKEGYTFHGWDKDNKFMPANNLTITALWTINNYTLRFVFNNSVDEDKVEIVDYIEQITYPDNPDKEGYSFNGWDNDTQLMPADNLTITALWEINNYTLRFVFNNSVDDDIVSILDYNEPITYPDDPEREGYTFYNWDNDSKFMPANNLTITALWEINNYTLKFVFNNSINEDKVEVLDYNEPITYPDDPEKEGYTFYDWDNVMQFMPAGNLTITALWTINNYTLRFIFNNSVDDDKVEILDYNEPITYPDNPEREGYTFYDWDNDTQFMQADNLTITALWTINNYTLKFVFNNSVDDDKVEILDYNEQITYPDDPEKEGYSFNGWDNDTQFMPADNLTITALWTINNYTLKFVFNNSVDEDKVETLDYNESITYPGDPEREGYTFYDWDSDIQFMPADNLIITALWTINNYTLRFIFNNSVDDDIVSILDYNDPIPYPDNPTKVGYTFYDWDSDSKSMPAENLIITALWIINNYTLRFVFNNSINEDKVEILDYNDHISYPDDPEKEGYTFYDWDNDTQFMPADNLTVTALWTINNYTLRFVFNNSMDDDKVEVLDYNTPITYPDNPEKEGYSFNEWDNDTQFMPADNLTITALWTINNYTLRFIFNNSIDDDVVSILDYNTSITYPDDPTKVGYTFYDWDNVMQFMPAENLIITALWTINNYTLRFIFNNSVDDVIVSVVDYNTPITYPDDPTKVGYTFYDWDSDSKFMPADNLTITALWIINNYTLKFVFNNSMDDDKVEVLDYNTPITYPDDPEKEGYSFYDWDNDTQFMPAGNLTITALWTVNNYTLIFIFNNSIDDDIVSILDYNDPISYPDDPEKEGYTFNGWDSDIKFMPANNFTIAALWEINNYTLKFVFNNSVDDDNVTVVDYNTLITYPDNPEKEGYTFYKWDNDTQLMPAENLIITALWIINNYTLRFVFNNSVDEDKVVIVDYNDHIVYPDNPTRVGYTFYNWDKDNKFMPAGNLTIIALWTANTYNVTLDLNGGDYISESSKEVTFNSTYGSLPVPERIGYGFVGWFTDNIKDDEKIEYNTTVTISKNHTLYAHWDSDALTLILNATGGTPGLSPIAIKYDDEYGSLLIPEKTGYSFDGWYTDATGGAKIEQNTKVTVPSSHTIYAHWTANNYTVIYDVNGGNIPAETEKNVTYDEPYGALLEAERTGYTFCGWYASTTSEEEITRETIVSTAKSHTLYAKWAINNYTLRFVFNNSVNDDMVEILDYNTQITYPDDPTKEGYTFYDWDSDAQFMPAENLTITALWTINNYTLRFVFNNSVDDDIVSILDYNTLISYPDDPTKEGYTFYDWDKENKFMPAENLIITALWTINNYTLRFVFNNSVDDDIVSVVDYNTPITYPDDPTKEGYTFYDWDKNNKFMPAENLIITALWTINNYTLRFVFNNSVDEDKVEILDYNTQITYPDSPTKVGYTFYDWDKDNKFMPADNLTITALWTINNYTLKFVFNNSVDDDIVSILDYNDPISYPENPTKEGYTFIGWDKNITVMPSSNLNITALWTINSYTLTFNFDNGTVIKETLRYNDPINYPEDTVVEGRAFFIWKSKPRAMPANDLTIKARWVRATQFVSIDIWSTDMTKSEIVEMLSKYGVGYEFTVDMLEYDMARGTTNVVIEFNNYEIANEYVDEVKKEIQGDINNPIKEIAVVYKGPSSYSFRSCPFFVFFGVTVAALSLVLL